AVDETRTPMGARMLRRWLSQPLLDAASIVARHDAVAWLAAHRAVRGRLAEALAAFPDLERLSSRAAQRTLTPREMLALAGAIRLLPSVRSVLGEAPPGLLAEAREQPGDFTPLAARIEEM